VVFRSHILNFSNLFVDKLR